MFHGIIQDKYKILLVEKLEGLYKVSISTDDYIINELSIGASISVDGVCLTVTEMNEYDISFDIISETLDKTTLKFITEGDLVNLERSARANDEIGGHKISGHVDGVAEVTNVQKPSNNYIISLFIDNKELYPYIFNKGYLSINGVSLTVNNWDYLLGTFQINLIPETLKRTNLGFLVAGNYVNIEIDRSTQAIVDTVFKFFQSITNSSDKEQDAQLSKKIAELFSGHKKDY